MYLNQGRHEQCMDILKIPRKSCYSYVMRKKKLDKVVKDEFVLKGTVK